MQLTAREEPSLIQKLRTELEVSRAMDSEEHEAADELRRQLHREEQLAELQRTSLLQEHKCHKACEADVQEFLQQLKKRLPGIARDLAISFAYTLYGGG